VFRTFCPYVPLIVTVKSYAWYHTSVFALLYPVATQKVGRRTMPSALWSMHRTEVYYGVYSSDFATAMIW